MDDRDLTLSGIVRVGIVTDRNADKKQVRVLFPDTKLTSGWLFVIQNTTPVSYVGENGYCTVGSFVPNINDKVLCLYIPVPNGDGFVLGVI